METVFKLSKSTLYAILFFSLCNLNFIDANKDVVAIDIEVVTGDPVYLPCDITTSNEKDQILLVLWYREDLGTPIYSVDARDRDFRLAERWSDDNVFANRAYFMTDKSPAELGVDHIRASDQGIYRCRVDFKMAQTRNTIINLTVIVPPQKVVITNETGEILSSVVGPYPKGASFTLRCDVFGAKPMPTVTWFRNDVLVSNSSVIIANVGRTHVRSQLRISNLGRRDVHSELMCSASNNQRIQSLSATVHVDMNFDPLDVTILGANQPLSAGRRYDLLCQSSGSRPPASITWWLDGQRLENAKKTTSSDGNTTTSTLAFTPNKEDSGKQLLCKAENSVLSSVKPLQYSWILEIHYNPQTVIRLGTSLNPDTIREGTDVYFDCITSAHPPVYKVEWKHNSRQLSINVNDGIIITNQSLVLQGVARTTAGNYTCVGYNTEGDGESHPFHLNVLFSPSCRPNQQKVYGVAKEEEAHIECQVEANPAEVQFRWVFNNSAETVNVAQTSIVKSGTVTSAVSYTPMTELDYGTLLCFATNRIGMQKVPCVFHIIAAGRPDQVHNCTISNISMTSFSIDCVESFNGGLPQSFLLEVRESQSQQVKSNLSSPIARFSVERLEVGVQYQAALFSYNSKGRSEPIILQVATLRLPEKQLTAGNHQYRFSVIRFTPMMSVVIGVLIALLVVSLVVILVIRVHHCGSSSHEKYSARRKNKSSIKFVSADLECRRNSDNINSDKDSPISGHDSSCGDSISDEKNPDIIPQSNSGDDDDDEYDDQNRCGNHVNETNFLSKRQHVSTIETVSSSPNRARYIATGYYTIRNGLHNSHHQHHQSPIQAAYVACTLPRLPSNINPSAASHIASAGYPYFSGPQLPMVHQRNVHFPKEPSAIPLQTLDSISTNIHSYHHQHHHSLQKSDKDQPNTKSTTSTINNKKESTV